MKLSDNVNPKVAWTILAIVVVFAIIVIT